MKQIISNIPGNLMFRQKRYSFNMDVVPDEDEKTIIGTRIRKLEIKDLLGGRILAKFQGGSWVRYPRKLDVPVTNLICKRYYTEINPIQEMEEDEVQEPDNSIAAT